MEKIIYYNYCALIIFVILLIATFFQKMTKGRRNHFYLAMLITSIVAIIADVVAVNLDKMGPGHLLGKYISHSVFLLTHNLISPLYLMFLVAKTDTWHRLKWSKLLKGLLFVPILVVATAIITNPFTDIIFYFDENDTYTRGSCILILYFVAVFYVIFGAVYLWRYRKLFRKNILASLMAVIVFTMIAAIIQLLYPWNLVEMFATACGLLVISMMVQRPEGTIDSITGFGKESAYHEDIQIGFAKNHI